ncbi:MAG: adenosine deaminase [Flavipsychrobacter sp.]|jgi:hypothetical protein|nr:adenosine deaminase [Flavipsychrobacter sp.]
MKRLFLFACLLGALSGNAQSIDRYFESIRNNRAELTAFFSAMPKGGDLHHHYSGSVYAETYIGYVVQQDYFIDTVSLKVDTSRNNDNCLRFSQLNSLKILPTFKQKLIQKWSVKDYNGVSYPSDKLFFETFSGFGIANNSQARLDTGILELKRRAIKENVSYIETMFTSITCGNTGGIDPNFNSQLLSAQAQGNEGLAMSILDKVFQQLQAKNVKQCAATFNNELTAMHNRLHIDDANFTMRYQNYVTRVVQPLDVFKNMVVCFESANTSPLIVGVNIVAPEDNETSMRDYWLHMMMYKFCHARYPSVKYAMHAGELTLGTVKPEDLSWHINAAVRTAGASRIGHGVDMPYEKDSYDLLRHMASSNTAIEINLYSNEFILHVKDDAHPLDLYREFGVPIVICTDDAGVLRSNLTHQYLLLATRYPDVSYREIKDYAFNSIEYSFIEEKTVKDNLRADLKMRFERFEREVLNTHK